MEGGMHVISVCLSHIGMAVAGRTRLSRARTRKSLYAICSTIALAVDGSRAQTDNTNLDKDPPVSV